MFLFHWSLLSYGLVPGKVISNLEKLVFTIHARPYSPLGNLRMGDAKIWFRNTNFFNFWRSLKIDKSLWIILVWNWINQGITIPFAQMNFFCHTRIDLFLQSK